MNTELEALKQLRADFDGWAFQYVLATDLPWEAKRFPFRFPPGGGIAWICAGSADRLRELIAAAVEIEGKR